MNDWMLRKYLANPETFDPARRLFDILFVPWFENPEHRRSSIMDFNPNDTETLARPDPAAAVAPPDDSHGLGEIAYNAFVDGAKHHGWPTILPRSFQGLEPELRASWDAAAGAVVYEFVKRFNAIRRGGR